MQFTIESARGRVPVDILTLHGPLDASNFEAVIAKVRELYHNGTRYLLIDLSDVPFMGSSGVVALHSAALLMRNQEPPDPEHGWVAFHALGAERDQTTEQFVKLLGPQPKVSRTLQMTGIDALLEIHTDREVALASF
jgi:anti-anti-sigma regulatory factor